MISSSLSSHFTSAKLSYFRLLCNFKVKRWESGAETHLCPAVSWCTLQWTLSLCYPSPPLPPSAPSTSYSHPLSSSPPFSSSSLCSQGCRRGEWTWRRAETNIKKVLTPLSWLTSGCSSSWNTADRGSYESPNWWWRPVEIKFTSSSRLTAVNTNGLRMDPCGTPALTLSSPETFLRFSLSAAFPPECCSLLKQLFW